MTQQEVAEWILDSLVNDLKLKPGDPMPDQQLKERYRGPQGRQRRHQGNEIRGGSGVAGMSAAVASSAD
jgi:hypothetical protein